MRGYHDIHFANPENPKDEMSISYLDVQNYAKTCFEHSRELIQFGKHDPSPEILATGIWRTLQNIEDTKILGQISQDFKEVADRQSAYNHEARKYTVAATVCILLGLVTVSSALSSGNEAHNVIDKMLTGTFIGGAILTLMSAVITEIVRPRALKRLSEHLQEATEHTQNWINEHTDFKSQMKSFISNPSYD